jgi:hypothetical protein
MIVSARTVFLVVYLAAPTVASGQATDSAGLRGLDSIGFVELQHTVNARRAIRVWTAAGRVELHHPQLNHSGLTFVSRAAAPIRDTLPLLDIRAIEVIKTKARLFAVGGAASIGVLGFVFSHIDPGCFGPYTSCGQVNERTVRLVTIASAVGGAILGAFIGAHVKGWEVVYAAP